MTDLCGRIRSCLIPLLLAAAWICGCASDPPLEAPVPPGEMVPKERVDNKLEDDPLTPGAGPTDHWYDTYHAYMSPEMRLEYRKTPLGERYERFSLRLLDFQLREDLLREHQDQLTREDRDRFRRLPSAEACRRFVRERAATANISSPSRK